MAEVVRLRTPQQKIERDTAAGLAEQPCATQHDMEAFVDACVACSQHTKQSSEDFKTTV